MLRIELRTTDHLFDFLRTPEREWSQVTLQALDLRPPAIDDALLKEELDARTAFLGCRMSGALARKAVSAGALILPARPQLPFDAFRTSLYDEAELLRGYDPEKQFTYLGTPDWRCYLASMDEDTKRKRVDVGLDDAVFHRLHDLAIERALATFLAARDPVSGAPRRVVGIMGGYDRERLEKLRDEYGLPTRADAPFMEVARLAWKLAQAGFTIATGGGPGAMEAANLGAWFANRTEETLRGAVRKLERVPRVRPVAPGSLRWNSGEWLAPAFEVMKEFPRLASDPRTESVGVPTWFYGHEPPNPFASHIAKFFENSIREEGVLGISTQGVIFAEGNAGTIQEIFQDAGQNYYATHGSAAPMVLLGTRYWNRAPLDTSASKDKAVWPLLRQLGAEKDFGHLLLISDDPDEIVRFLKGPPRRA